MNKKNHLLNNSGFSLLEALLASGLLASLAIGLSTVFSSQRKESRRMAQKLAVNSLKSSFIATVQDQQACAYNLDSSRDSSLTFDSTQPNQKLTVSEIRTGSLASAPIIAREGLQIEAGLEIQSITLEDINEAGTGKISGRWTISFLSRNPGEKAQSSIVLNPQTFNVDTSTPTSARIVACETLLAGDLPWILGGNDLRLNPISFFGISTPFVIPGHELVFRRNGVISARISTTDTSYGVNSSTVSSLGENVALGVSALSVNTGSRNVAAGWEALSSNTSGNDNMAIGAGALRNNTLGSHNVALGSAALFSNTSGQHNTAVGSQTQYSLTTGSYNTSAGAYSLHRLTTGNSNIAIGFESSLNATTASHNLAIGSFSMRENNIGTYNIALGTSALRSDSYALRNVAIGFESQKGQPVSTQITSRNTSVGYRSLMTNLRGINYTAFGSSTVTGPLYGQNATVFGAFSLQNIYFSLGGSAIGHEALKNQLSAIAATAAGSGALTLSMYDTMNTAIGYRALYNNTIGINSTAIGSQADNSISTINNTVSIGAGAIADSPNKIRLGNASVTVVESAVPFSTPSDRTLKTRIKDYPHGLDLILKLRPVSYNYKSDSKKTPQIGFIAQEIERTKIHFPGLLKPQHAENFFSLAYSQMVVPIINALKELNSKLMDISKEQDELKDDADEMETRVQRSKERLNRLARLSV